MYNIQKAVSRLDFAPKLREIDVTDVKSGIAVFTPKPDKTVSFARLKDELKHAGYKLASAEITAAGTLERDASGWWLITDPSGQRFLLEATGLGKLLMGFEPGARVEIAGDWKTAGKGTVARETVAPVSVKKDEGTPAKDADENDASLNGSIFRKASLERADIEPRDAEVEAEHVALELSPLSNAVAPIRTTSPGLTVYRGGAITPRASFTRQRLGDLRVERQTVSLAASYTPTPRLQLEAEIPFSRSSFDDGTDEGEGAGLGNVTVRGKYRFYRSVEEWGDRQAAFRLGLELPTGKRSAPAATELNAPPFVRQQLTPINGGLAALLDLAYSQARGRTIFGTNVEGVVRAERAGFHTGHELRINTDLEYVVFPFNYRRPTGEIFAIIETSYIRRGRGRVGGAEVAESGSTELYLAPAVQYVATTRVVVEGSVQIPVFQRAGAQMLRTTGNVLIGVRYLF